VADDRLEVVLHEPLLDQVWLRERAPDRRVPDESIFHVNRGNPFTAALDDVLKAIGDLQIAVLHSRSGIAGAPVTVDESVG
jgi:hypothetical protein